MIPIPKNHNSGSEGYFGGIGTWIVMKGIVKGIEKKLFYNSNSSFHEQAKGITIHDESWFLNLRNRATSNPSFSSHCRRWLRRCRSRSISSPSPASSHSSPRNSEGGALHSGWKDSDQCEKPLKYSGNRIYSAVWGGKLSKRFCKQISESSPGHWAELQLPCSPDCTGCPGRKKLYIQIIDSDLLKRVVNIY